MAAVSEQTRQRWSTSRKGAGNPMWGRHHSKQAIEKNRIAHLGKKHNYSKKMSEESRKKMSLSKKGIRNPNFGKKYIGKNLRLTMAK
jgi:hypothetical protein